jgi:hypothetical protein
LEESQCEQTLPVLAALELTVMKAELAFAKAIVEKGRMTESEIPLREERENYIPIYKKVF